MNIDESYLTFYSGPKSDHFNGETFFNPWNPMPRKGFWDVVKWRMNGNHAKWPEKVENEPRPALEPTIENGLKVTYIGHATFLIQVDGLNLLIDPFFSERASPFSHIGPRRARPPFVSLEKLPKIDYVFVSHNHYDHLDLASISWLARNHKPFIITPLGNTRLMKPCADGCSMMALDWHQDALLGDKATLTLTPSQHWSRRGISDTSRDLWGGFVLKTKTGKSLYFAGDSGFDEGLFGDIFKRHGAPDIALIPIGAYEPRWFMQYSHMNPDDAVQVHKILQAKKSVACHFETIQLTDEAIGAPRQDLAQALKTRNVPAENFIAPYPGDSFIA